MEEGKLAAGVCSGHRQPTFKPNATTAVLGIHVLRGAGGFVVHSWRKSITSVLGVCVCPARSGCSLSREYRQLGVLSPSLGEGMAWEAGKVWGCLCR